MRRRRSLDRRAERGVHQVDDGWLVAQHDPVNEQVMGADNRAVHVQSPAMLSASRDSSYDRAMP